MSHNPCISLGFSSPLYTTNKLRRVLITAQVILQRGEPSPAGWGSSGGYAPPPSKQRFPTLPSIHTSWPRLLVEWWLLGGESSVLEVGPRRKKKHSKKLPSRWWPTPFFIGSSQKITSVYQWRCRFCGCGTRFRTSRLDASSYFAPPSSEWTNFYLATLTWWQKKRRCWLWCSSTCIVTNYKPWSLSRQSSFWPQ